MSTNLDDQVNQDLQVRSLDPLTSSPTDMEAAATLMSLGRDSADREAAATLMSLGRDSANRNAIDGRAAFTYGNGDVPTMTR